MFSIQLKKNKSDIEINNNVWLTIAYTLTTVGLSICKIKHQSLSGHFPFSINFPGLLLEELFWIASFLFAIFLGLISANKCFKCLSYFFIVIFILCILGLHNNDEIGTLILFLVGTISVVNVVLFLIKNFCFIKTRDS